MTGCLYCFKTFSCWVGWIMNWRCPFCQHELTEIDNQPELVLPEKY